MLEELHVAALGVIEDARLELAPGLNVLTGETGAGKTLVTVGLSMALGARASAGLVRQGHRTMAVEARLSVEAADPELAEWVEGDQVVLARTVGADGRGSARVTGRLAPVSTLAALGERLVEIHGQNQAERLRSPAAQTSFLDRFAGAGHLAVLQGYLDVHGELRLVRDALDGVGRDAREREREKDLLAYQVKEIDAARVRPGELAGLAEEEARLAHAERILELVAGAEAALGGPGGAAEGSPGAGGADAMRAAAAALDATLALDPGAQDLAQRLASLMAESEDVLAQVRAYRESVQVDPARLEAVRDRIQALKALERKYGDGEDGIVAYLEEARARMASLEGEDGERTALAERVAHLRSEAERLAAQVTAGRAAAAPRLSRALTAEVRELGMPGAAVEVRLAAMPALEALGAERAELELSGGPAQPARALAKVASGGELSRAMLACRSVLAELDDVPTLVFDEVDAGIGGRTAGAVGRRLAALGAHRQVLVVTHLAQIAVRADRHFLVTKEDGTASVRVVEGDDRVVELARMLSGSTSDASLAHARELVDRALQPAGAGARGRRQG